MVVHKAFKKKNGAGDDRWAGINRTRKDMVKNTSNYFVWELFTTKVWYLFRNRQR